MPEEKPIIPISVEVVGISNHKGKKMGKINPDFLPLFCQRHIDDCCVPKNSRGETLPCEPNPTCFYECGAYIDLKVTPNALRFLNLGSEYITVPVTKHDGTPLSGQLLQTLTAKELRTRCSQAVIKKGLFPTRIVCNFCGGYDCLSSQSQDWCTRAHASVRMPLLGTKS
jgi:hypothetical protein